MVAVGLCILVLKNIIWLLKIFFFLLCDLNLTISPVCMSLTEMERKFVLDVMSRYTICNSKEKIVFESMCFKANKTNLNFFSTEVLLKVCQPNIYYSRYFIKTQIWTLRLKLTASFSRLEVGLALFSVSGSSRVHVVW